MMNSQREKTRGERKPSQPKELTGGCDPSARGQEVSDVAAEASGPDSLAPCARGGFHIREPDQLGGALEVDAFWHRVEIIRTMAQSASGQKVSFQSLLHSLEQKKQHPDSEPSTLDSQSSTLFLSSEEPGPSATALPSPSSSCEPQAFSPSVLPSLLPPQLPRAPAPPGPGAPRRTGLYSVVASSPEAAPRLLDWLPGCPSATPPGGRGEEREWPAPVQGPERGRAQHLGSSAREESPEDAGTALPPATPPVVTATPASLEANVGDILVELRTMNGHLGVIAKALTKLASSLGPQPQPQPLPGGADDN